MSATHDGTGILRVRLSHAIGLKSTDSNGFSDPYVKLTLGKQKFTSKKVYKSLNPRWDEDYAFRGGFAALLAEPLHVAVWDYDRMSFNDSLGDASLNLRSLNLEHGTRIECAVQLKDQQAVPGEVFFVIQWEFDIPPADLQSQGATPAYTPHQQPTGWAPTTFAAATPQVHHHHHVTAAAVAAAAAARVPPPVSTPGLQGASIPTRIAATFQKFDTNRSGFLDYGELRNALRHYGLEANTQQASELVRRYDDHPDGKLELKEFAELVRDVEQGVLRANPAQRSPYDPKARVPARVAAAFDDFDANRSGYLDYRELRPALRRYGLDTSEGEAASLVRRYDDHPNGKLDVVEFSRLVRDIEHGLLRSTEQHLRAGGRTPGGAPQGGARGGRTPSSTPQWRSGGGGGGGGGGAAVGGAHDAQIEVCCDAPAAACAACTRGLGYAVDVLFRGLVYAVLTSLILAPGKLRDTISLAANVALNLTHYLQLSLGADSTIAQLIALFPALPWVGLAALVVLIVWCCDCCGLRSLLSTRCSASSWARLCSSLAACCCCRCSRGRGGSFDRYYDPYHDLEDARHAPRSYGRRRWP